MMGRGRRAGRRGGRRAARRGVRRQGRRSDAAAGPAEEAAAQPPPGEPISAAEEPGYTAELEKLAQLKNQGILTEEEFAAKKKQVLGLM